MNILVVCLGNICRSPLAHGLLEQKIGHKHLIDSAGTASYHVGEPPDHRSIKIAAKHGINIQSQKARTFSTKDFELFDYIFVMDKSNFNHLLQLATSNLQKKKIHLISNQNIPDPYHRDISAFEEVYQLLNQATEHLIKEYQLS